MNLKNLIFFIFIISISNYCCSQNVHSIDIDSSITYSLYLNKKFKLSIPIPNDWYIYNEEQEGRKKLTSQWYLPKVFDSILDRKIKNIVYIKAFRNRSIKNTDDMILSAYLHIAGSNTALEFEPNISGNSRILYMDASNGEKYKGKVYFKYHNNIGYRITFMATPDTYEQDLNKYEDFISSLKFD